MDWQPVPAEGSFIAEGFAFSGGGRVDVRLAYRTLGTLAPDRGNAVLLLHGTAGSGRQFLQPAFAGAMFGPGGPLDAYEYFIILPDAIGHGGSSKPSDGLGQSFPCYGYACRSAWKFGSDALSLIMDTGRATEEQKTAWWHRSHDLSPHLQTKSALNGCEVTWLSRILVLSARVRQSQFWMLIDNHGDRQTALVSRFRGYPALT